MKNNAIFAAQYDDSVSYGVSVERIRQILETGHIDRYDHIGVLFSIFSVSRGVWRCLFYLKGGRGALFHFRCVGFCVPAETKITKYPKC